eukprot:CAMPEP_0177545086 /NCGR_PEP_ID=MMETSP0369-20130122/62372_1 /TAXON_ID=447022 ORGANISM="Scrippsiella hangoei-like, Strain SHHI-4" /NCGR_SAMPLE_ID=MMETSP0369 /ASSEMBLY_ACC=CAM_ASM_000364 /LENGTH=235 /DNA_ID=CAMNT_0019029239 /DNA_START=108 /DNA_END=811 /DNA_ORIENTATION=+
MGVFEGDRPEFYFQVLPQGPDTFVLQHQDSQMLLYSNADGRIGCFYGEERYDDQLFQLEDRTGQLLQLLDSPCGCVGLRDTGFRWLADVPEPRIFTDAFQSAQYIFDPGSSYLLEIGEQLRLQVSVTWGEARDMCLHEMDRPHAWAIEHIPLLRQLADAGLISSSHQGNVSYGDSEGEFEEFAGDGHAADAGDQVRARPREQRRAGAAQRRLEAGVARSEPPRRRGHRSQRLARR